jgi:molybdopterin-containing oxidoreductase family iron-sulfur binding subunit
MSQQHDNHEKKEDSGSGRRNFLKLGLLTAGLTIAGGGLQKVLSDEKEESGEKVKVLTAEGKLLEVDSSHLNEHHHCGASPRDSRKGVPGKKYVMVIDLSRCKNALKCQKACQKHHFLPEQDKWLKVYKMQDAPETSPYWMPKPCLHCDKPPCVKVCPVDATFKRSDGLVLIDNERCIGCRFCMAACPYSTRTFNWEEPMQPANVEEMTYSPETSTPRKKGTVEKCDFCPDMLKQGKLPHCVTACPNGVYYFGDANEDTVCNGDETVRFRQLLKDKAGYRYMESLGTEPSVYYLPAANRLFPFKDAVEGEANS